MGQVRNRPTRQSMLSYLKKLDGDFFENSNESWQSSDKIDTKEYRKILEQSVFAPCPRGNESVDSFRLYESIEAGAIPIPERGDYYWDNLFQNNHPFKMQANKDWSNIPKWIEYFMSNEDALNKYRQNIQFWWKNYKQKLNKNILQIINKPPKQDRPSQIKNTIIESPYQEKKHFDFIEIGTCDFETEIQNCGEDSVGLSVDPLKLYLDRLPDKKNVKKINCAISNEPGEMDVYYVPPEIIKKYKLPIWLKGCSCVGKIHPSILGETKDSAYAVSTIIKEHLLKNNLKPHDIVEKQKTQIITPQLLIEQNGVKSIGFLKTDTEGFDIKIIRAFLDLFKIYPELIPEKIEFESNDMYSKQEVLDLIKDIKKLNFEILETGHSTTLKRKNNVFVNKKVKEFIKLKNQWANFKYYNFLNYISEFIPKENYPKEEYTMYNPGKKIAIVSLYTQEISDYAIHSENSIKEYCKKQDYTFHVYRNKIDKDSSPSWSKAQALLNHIEDHDYLIWMDSDTLIFNPEKKFKDIISKCSRKFIIATKDIGENSMLNSGVLIFKSHNYTKNLIKKWRDFNGDKSSLYASGGDQEILCQILKKSDPFGYNRKVFEMNEFNTDPRFVDKDTFILHFMAYPHKLKKIFMSYWQK